MTESELKRAKEAEDASRQADELVGHILDELSLEELEDFNVYHDQINYDYRTQERARLKKGFGAGKKVQSSKYSKLPGQETKTWWSKVQGLFTDDEGQTMGFHVESAVRRYTGEKARNNPIM